MPEFVIPDLPDVLFMKPFFPFTLNPGQSLTISRDIIDILYFLMEKDWQKSDILEFKGFFKDQLDREYVSDSIKYIFKEIIALAGINS